MNETETREAEGVNPYAAPVTDDGLAWRAESPRASTKFVRPYDFPLASRWHRWLARFVDFFVVMVPAFVSGVVLGLVQVWSGGDGSPMFGSDEQLFVAANALGVVVAIPLLVYQWHLIVKRGATIGKKLLGLRIVHADGRPLTWQGTILLREALPGLLGLVPPARPLLILEVLPIFGKDRTCIHDLLVNTRVIYVGLEPEDWTPEAIAASRWKEGLPG